MKTGQKFTLFGPGLMAMVLTASPALAQDWPHYRGPDYDGIAPVQDLLQGKAFGFEVDWIRASRRVFGDHLLLIELTTTGQFGGC